MLRKRIFLSFIALGISLFANAQQTPIKTSDYGLLGYPTSVRYQRYETDSVNPTKQRTSFIDDYTLNFNERRDLVQRVNYINGKKDRYIVFTYDNALNLVKEELFETNGKIVSTTNYEYGYIGRLADQTTVEYPASLGGANKQVRKQTYKYNNKGLLEETEIFGDDAKIQKNIKYYYGPQDSLIYTISTYGYNKNIDKTTYKRDFKHDVIEMTMFRNDKQTRREVYELNDKSLIVAKKVYDGKNKLTLSYEYTYDEHNYLLSEVAVDGRGNTAIEYYYKYEKDSFFNWTKRTIYDSWNPKYIETRKIDYSKKDHFYDDLKDAATKKVILERSQEQQ